MTNDDSLPVRSARGRSLRAGDPFYTFLVLVAGLAWLAIAIGALSDPSRLVPQWWVGAVALIHALSRLAEWRRSTRG